MQDYVNLEIKKKSGLSLNPDIHHSKVPSSGCKDRGIRKFEFVAKTQFLHKNEGNFYFVKRAEILTTLGENENIIITIYLSLHKPVGS